MQLVDRIAARLGFERRSSDWLGSWFGGSLGGLAGASASVFARDVQVNARLAENLAGVTASVNAIASAIAAAPALIYQAGRGARVEVVDHPLRALIDRAPNMHMTWPGLMESMVGDVLLSGNALIEIEREPSGRISALRHIPWQSVTASIGPSGRLIYDVAEVSFLGAQTRPRRLLSGDVVHLRDRSDDGYIGRSRLSRATGAFTTALRGEEHYSSFLANGARPCGVIEVGEGGKLGPERLAELRAQFDQNHAGAGKAGRALILGSGLKYSPIGVSPEDAELLASRKFALEEIARIFAVPPPMIGDLSHGTFTNSREAARWFAQFTLTPWARKIEAAFTHALFPEGSGLSLELDLSGLLRGDPETRWASHKIAVDAGILDADEVREIEGFNPRGGSKIG